MPAKRTRSPVVVIDLFSGCGGTSAGFRIAGMSPIAAVENNGDAVATYRANFPGALVIAEDIRLVSSDAFEAVVATERARGARVVLAACAPCQPFSRQRQGDGADDQRVDLLADVARFVESVCPDAIFLENVPGLETRANRYGPFTALMARFRDLDYHVDRTIAWSSDYGIPQRRRRLIVLASRTEGLKCPPPTHGPGSAQPVKVRDAIAGLPHLAAGERHPTLNGHEAMRLSAINLRRLRATPEGGSHRDWPEYLKLPCHVDRDDSYSDAYGRLAWDAQAPAMTTRCISYSNGRFGHPEQDRGLTPREAASLQTFPIEFTFEGSMTSIARQVGNAVPVRLAATFGTTIVKHLMAQESAADAA